MPQDPNIPDTPADPLTATGVRLPPAAPVATPRARWTVCLAAAACFHAGAAAALLGPWSGALPQVADAPVITVELATLPAAPDVKPNELPPGPQQSEAQPKSDPQPARPVERTEQPPRSSDEPLVTAALPPEPPGEPIVVATTPPPKVEEKPAEKTPAKPSRASLASAPAHAERKAQRAGAPSPGASAHDANAVPGWTSLLMASLERHKRYPSEAEARGEHGVTELAFSVDRRGGVHHARIAHSSGSSLLDRATLAMLERAAPLPPPPVEVAGAEIPIRVPIRYDSR